MLWKNRNKRIGLVCLCLELGLLTGQSASGHILVIDSILGRRGRVVEGVKTMRQPDVAEQAALLALSLEGWNLGVVNEPNPFGIPRWLGPPYWSSVTGEGEWSLGRIPAEYSNHWGYDLNPLAIRYGNGRYLIFHTDDTISRGGHDLGEPSGFGIISGLMDGFNLQVGEKSWGEFYVVADPTTPVAPTWPDNAALIVSDIGLETLSLTWTAAVHDLGVAQYRIYQDGTLIVTLAGSVQTYQVTGLEPDTSYTFKVEASDLWGPSSISTDGPSVTVNTSSPVPPMWPEGSSLTASDIGLTEMTLTWTAATHDFGVAQYLVFRDDVLIDAVDGTVQTYYATGLEPETSYTLKVEASNQWGVCSSDGPTVTAQTGAPADAIVEVIGDVLNLNLQQGIENNLDAKLDSAFQALDDLNENNNVAAINSLQAFINAVEAQRSKQISDADANALIAAANDIISSLSP